MSNGTRLRARLGRIVLYSAVVARTWRLRYIRYIIIQILSYSQTQEQRQTTNLFFWNSTTFFYSWESEMSQSQIRHWIKSFARFCSFFCELRKWCSNNLNRHCLKFKLFNTCAFLSFMFRNVVRTQTVFQVLTLTTSIES